MSAILEIPEVRQRLSPLSVEEYHRLWESENTRRTELIRGFVIEKMAKSPLHRTAGSLLYDLLSAKLPRGYSIQEWLQCASIPALQFRVGDLFP